jgi:flagellar basal body P-ring formation protein FlgA
MKQASNSLLTLCQFPFKAIPIVPAFPRDKAGANGRHLTPFYVHRGNSQMGRQISLGWSCSPRSNVRSRLGEGRIRSLLLGICFLVNGLGGMVASDLVPDTNTPAIILKEEVVIPSRDIMLQDVADLQGFDSDSLKRLAQIPLGAPPVFGAPMTMSRHQVGERIQAFSGTALKATLTGAPVVRIALKGRPAQESEISAALRAYLLETTPWKESEIEIRSLADLKNIELPPGEASLRVSSAGSILGHKNLLAAIEVTQAEKTLRCFWVNAEVRVRAEVLTASRKLIYGTVIAPEDIVRTVIEVPDLRTSYVRNSEDALGKSSRRNFAPGDPLTREALMDPFLVKNGETVQLRLERNGLVLRSLARAEQDGRLGQIIKVRNLDFSTLLKAQVTGRAEVKIP